MFEGPSQDYKLTMCTCGYIYYGICLRQKGCAAKYMTECVERFMRFDCDDMTVCGNNCLNTNPDNPHDFNAHPNDLSYQNYDLAEQTIIERNESWIIPVNNFGNNYLRFSTCTQSVDETYLQRYAAVRIPHCAGDKLTQCPYWVPPKTFTALAFPRKDTYCIVMEYCVVTNFDAYCLKAPVPRRIYGNPLYFPTTIDIDFTQATYCEQDSDCQGSVCDTRQSPPTCVRKYISNLYGSGKDYFEHG